jgi:hypothetical protein
MANKYLQQFIWSFLKKFTKVVAEIEIASDGSVSDFYGPGIASVEESDAGEYTIVFNDKFVKFMGAHFTVLAATAVDLVPQVASFDASTKTLVVNLNTGATPTQVAAALTLYMEANFRDHSASY